MTEELNLFIEDTELQLQKMENALLEFDGDVSLVVGDLFRAMHTIKGSAGMFGLNQMVDFTHYVESVLDLVRKDTIPFDEDLQEVLFEVKDIVSKMLDFLKNQQEYDIPFKESVNTVKERLSQKLGNNKVVSTTAKQSDFSPSPSNTPVKWDLKISFSKDFLKLGLDIIPVLNYAKKHGVFLDSSTSLNDSIVFDGFDFKTMFLELHLVYETSLSREGVLELFEFIEDELVIDLKPYIEPIKQTLNEQQKVVVNKVSLEVAKTSAIRVDSKKIDALINKVGELIINNSKLLDYVSKNEIEDLEDISNDMNNFLEAVMEGVLDLRMVRVRDSFVKFKRIVKEIAKTLNKEIQFEIEGGETELDKVLVEKISGPLIHMLRNSIDHGIESKKDRSKLGKSQEGKITLRVFPQGDTVVIEIEDDGQGLNKSKIITKALENGLITSQQLKTISDNEIFRLIFHNGFSTVTQVSDISGRGVGMDVVKNNIEELQGEIHIQSIEGKGSLFRITLPLTLAIINGFEFLLNDQVYILPTLDIQECLMFNKDIKSLNETTINVRGEVYPLVDLVEYFNEKQDSTLHQNVIMVKYKQTKVGLKVNDLLGEQQIVIKPLGGMFVNSKEYSGGAILGDGRVGLIINSQKLIEKIINKGL